MVALQEEAALGKGGGLGENVPSGTACLRPPPPHFLPSRYRMYVPGDPVLRLKCEPVKAEEISSPHITQLVDQMKSTLGKSLKKKFPLIL